MPEPFIGGGGSTISRSYVWVVKSTWLRPSAMRMWPSGLASTEEASGKKSPIMPGTDGTSSTASTCKPSMRALR